VAAEAFAVFYVFPPTDGTKGSGRVNLEDVFLHQFLVAKLAGTLRTVDDLGQVVDHHVLGDDDFHVGAERAQVAVESVKINFLIYFCQIKNYCFLLEIPGVMSVLGVKVSLEVLLVIEVLAALAEIAPGPVLEVRVPDVLTHLGGGGALEAANSALASHPFAVLELVSPVGRHARGDFDFFLGAQLRVPPSQGSAGEGRLAVRATQVLEVIFKRYRQISVKNVFFF